LKLPSERVMRIENLNLARLKKVSIITTSHNFA
jgi:hypothetical protein